MKLSLRPINGRMAVAFAAVVAWLIYAVTTGDPVFGHPPARPFIGLAAVVATCLTAILAAGWLVETGLAVALTAFHRSILYGLLTLVAGIICMSWLGYDIRVVLATSVVGSAIVGFAMQPVLTSIFAGLAVSVDRTIHVGDGVVLGTEIVQVETLTWRNVRGRRRDGTVAVLPNGKLADSELRILPRDTPVRSEITVKLPAKRSPREVAEIMYDILAEVPGMADTHPLTVAPLAHDPDAAVVPYALRWWAARFADTERVEAAINERLWYGLRRHGLTANPEAPERDDLTAGLPDLDDDAITALQDSGTILRFAPGERLTLPLQYRDRRFVLLRGSVGAAAVETGDGRSASLHALTAALAAEIGPYAEFAARKWARTTADFATLSRHLADEIPDPARRARFLAGLPKPVVALHPPGEHLSFQEMAGRLMCQPATHAVTEVVLLAAPADALSPAAAGSPVAQGRG